MNDSTQPRMPWWRVPTMWLVLGGPLIVVLAGIVTTVIAVSGADRVVQHTISVSDPAAPAVQARNHSATR